MQYYHQLFFILLPQMKYLKIQITPLFTKNPISCLLKSHISKLYKKISLFYSRSNKKIPNPHDIIYIMWFLSQHNLYYVVVHKNISILCYFT